MLDDNSYMCPQFSRLVVLDDNSYQDALVLFVLIPHNVHI